MGQTGVGLGGWWGGSHHQKCFCILTQLQTHNSYQSNFTIKKHVVKSYILRELELNPWICVCVTACVDGIHMTQLSHIGSLYASNLGEKAAVILSLCLLTTPCQVSVKCGGRWCQHRMTWTPGVTAPPLLMLLMAEIPGYLLTPTQTIETQTIEIQTIEILNIERGQLTFCWRRLPRLL